MRRYLNRTGTVPGYEPKRLALAADAALNASGNKAGMAYLGSDGAWGVILRPADGNHSVCVLRAVYYALDRDVTQDEITVYTDAREAWAALTAWKRGADYLPRGLDPQHEGRAHVLALREKVASAPRRFSFLLAQAGNPLAEYADSAARLAVRAESGLRGRLEVTQQAPRWAQARIQEWGVSQEER